MNKTLPALVLLLTLVTPIAGCGSLIAQLRDKANEDLLLRPGALDIPVPQHFTQRSFIFLDRYVVRHDWPVASSCQYHTMAASGADPDGFYRGGPMFVGRFVERGKRMVQDEADVLFNADQDVEALFAANEYLAPIYETVAGKAVVVGHRKAWTDWQAACFQGWKGLRQSVGLWFSRRSLDEFAAIEEAKPQPGQSKSWERIGYTDWLVYRNPPRPYWRPSLSEPYLRYYARIADSGFTVKFELTALEESLQNPIAFAAMGGMFRHLLESFRVDPLNEETAAAQAELRRRARELEWQSSCAKTPPRLPPAPWCEKLAKP